MKPIAAICATLGLVACMPDETISGYIEPGSQYRLTNIDGVAFNAKATIGFPAEGEIVGQAPCNRYSASQSVPYPWFELGPIRATRATCPDQAAENTFFAQLGTMQFAEANGPVLILTNDSGNEMVFHRIDE